VTLAISEQMTGSSGTNTCWLNLSTLMYVKLFA